MPSRQMLQVAGPLKKFFLFFCQALSLFSGSIICFISHRIHLRAYVERLPDDDAFHFISNCWHFDGTKKIEHQQRNVLSFEINSMSSSDPRHDDVQKKRMKIPANKERNTLIIRWYVFLSALQKKVPYKEESSWVLQLNKSIR